VGTLFLNVKKKIFRYVAVAWCIFQLYTGFFGVLAPLQQRAIYTFFAVVLVYMMYPMSKKLDKNKMYLDQYIAIILITIAAAYLVINNYEITLNTGTYTMFEKVFAAIIVIISIDAARRVTGWGLVGVALAFLVYAYLGPYMPGPISHPGASFTKIVTRLGWSIEAIFGICVDACASFIYLFIFYAKVLEKTGGGQVFIDLASGLVGMVRGGPAKVSVFASSLFGSISGSAMANVAGTGTFTIPLMKSIGYKPHFAGAVEAVASTGGQFMPPIMGASAFLIAEVLEITYLKVALYALIPAFLYYATVFIMVDLEAAKLNLKGIPREKLPSLRKTFKEGWPALMSPLVLVFLLAVMRWSPAKSAVWAILVTFVVTQIGKNTRLSFTQFIDTMEEGSKGALETSIACLAIGIVIGCVTLTGLALKLSTVLVSLAGGRVFILLLLTMVASIIFGMGLPTIACYMVLAMMVAPALVEIGILPIAAHLFIFYFGIISAITPPVALASYVATGIAQSNYWKTCFTAIKLGVTAFIIPFLFVYNPALVMQGGFLEVIQCTITAFLGVYAISTVLQGYLLTKLPLWQRLVFSVAGIALIFPETNSDVIGFIAFAIMVLVHVLYKKKNVTSQDTTA